VNARGDIPTDVTGVLTTYSVMGNRCDVETTDLEGDLLSSVADRTGAVEVHILGG
jgi:hypothetical protein